MGPYGAAGDDVVPRRGLSGGCRPGLNRERWSCDASAYPEGPDEHPSERAIDAVAATMGLCAKTVRK